MVIVTKRINQRVQRTFGQDRHKCICISLSHVPTRLQKKTKWKRSKQYIFFQNRFNIYFFFSLQYFIGKIYSTWDDNKYM